MRVAGAGRSLTRGVLVIAVAVHLVVLYAPTAPSAPGLPGIDKVVHITVFAAVVWAARAAGLRRKPVVLAALTHALVSEALQHWLLLGRTGDPLDVLADAVGVAVGALVPLVPGLVAPRLVEPPAGPREDHGTMAG